MRKQNVMRLALLDDLNMLTAVEARKLARELDIYVGNLKKPGLISKLQTYNCEGREYLCANMGHYCLANDVIHLTVCGN